MAKARPTRKTNSAPRRTSATPLSSIVGVRKGPKPNFVEPCLATLVKAAPRDDMWVHEIKFDGYRVQAHIDRGGVKLLTRKGLNWTKRFGDLPERIKAMNLHGAIIDGEVVVEDKNGQSSFSALAASLSDGVGDFVYQCFDLLYLDGFDLRGASLADRKVALFSLFEQKAAKGPIRYSAHLEGDGATMLKEACRLGLEGLISKRADRVYHSGRHDDWVKSKCIKTDEFVIGGFIPSNVTKSSIGALALGYYDRRRLIYAGRVGTGFTQQSASALFRNLEPLKVSVCPFDGSLTALQRRHVVWVKPRAVAQIEYRAWTGDGLLRHAAFKALREDKPAVDVRRPSQS